MASLRPVRPRNAPGTAVAPLRAGRERIIRQGQAACVGKTIVSEDWREWHCLHFMLEVTYFLMIFYVLHVSFFLSWSCICRLPGLRTLTGHLYCCFSTAISYQLLFLALEEMEIDMYSDSCSQGSIHCDARGGESTVLYTVYSILCIFT